MGIWNNIKRRVRKYVSPMFIVLFFVSLTMWYLTKLSYNYTAEVPVDVDIEGNRFRVTALAEGPGYRIFSHRIFRQNRIVLNFTDIHTTPSVINSGHYVIDPYSLQNAISTKYGDIRIISLDGIPEISYDL